MASTYQYGVQCSYYTEQHAVYNDMLLWDPYPLIVMIWTLEKMAKGGRIVVGNIHPSMGMICHPPTLNHPPHPSLPRVEQHAALLLLRLSYS